MIKIDMKLDLKIHNSYVYWIGIDLRVKLHVSVQFVEKYDDLSSSRTKKLELQNCNFSQNEISRLEKKYHECSHSNFFDMIHIINAISNTQFAVKVHISFACLKMCLFWQRCVMRGKDNFVIKGLVKDLLYQSLVMLND